MFPPHLLAKVIMSTSAPQFSPAEWDAVIDKFLVSGLTQSAFCHGENLSRYRFACHYRRSDKFAGRRRDPIHTGKTNEQTGSGFRTVQQKTVPGVEPQYAESVSIHIGDNVGDIAIRRHCSDGVGRQGQHWQIRFKAAWPAASCHPGRRLCPSADNGRYGHESEHVLR